MEPVAGSSNRNSAFTYTTSQRGGPILMHNNRQYRKFKTYKGGSVFWRCREGTCPGALTVNRYVDITKIKDHICEPKSNNQVFILKATEELQKQSASTDVPIPTLFKNKCEELLDQGLNLATDLPNFRNIKSRLYNIRNKAHGVSRLFAKTPEDVQVPKQYLDFLLADYKHGKSRILLFGTEKSKEGLAKTRHLYCDGTFKCSPKPFRQIYSIHGEIDGVVKPLAYALLLNKTKPTYIKVFQLLKSSVPDMQVDLFTSDFEEAAIRGVQAVFPNVSIKGCYFHFKKALKMKGKELGLNENSIHRKHLALCTVLPHLPPEDLDDAWLYIMGDSPREENVTKFNDYMVTQWIDHEFWSNKWSCYKQVNKTNNFTESHYSVLNKTINKNSSKSLVRLLGIFKSNCNHFTEIRKKMEVSKLQVEAINRNTLIDTIIEEYKSDSITIGHCLEKLRF